VTRFNADRWAEAFIRSAGVGAESALAALESIRDGIRQLDVLPEGSRDGPRFAQSLAAAFGRGLPKEYGSAGETARRFAVLLARRHRLGSLGAMTAAVRAQLDLADGIILVRVESGRPLNEAIRKKLHAVLAARTGARELRLEEKVNAALLGGLRIQIGWERIDGSLLGRLAGLAGTLDVDIRGAPYGQI